MVRDSLNELIKSAEGEIFLNKFPVKPPLFFHLLK
jgi:hypothetical protein